MFNALFLPSKVVDLACRVVPSFVLRSGRYNIEWDLEFFASSSDFSSLNHTSRCRHLCLSFSREEHRVLVVVFIIASSLLLVLLRATCFNGSNPFALQDLPQATTLQ